MSVTRLSLAWMAVVALLATPLAGEAQTARKVPSIGYLCTYPCGGPRYQAFVDSLEALGYVNGRTVDLVYPGYASTEPQDLNQLSVIAADMVRKKVDVIFAAGDVFAARAAKQATSTIPIVMAISGDPVKLGLVTSLARPGGNLTRITYLEDELVAKQIELLKEVLSTLSRVGALVDSADPGLPNTLPKLDAVARSLGVGLNTVQVRGPTNFEAEFAMLTRGGARAFVILHSPRFYFRYSRIAALAGRRRLVGVASFREFAESRGILAYGPRIPDVFQRAASLIDQILKGARPANLPVEQPTRFELVVNLLAAKDLGLTIPPSVLARADEVIE
jgi:putative tryptophan/tyrosine transport system substrate-binding protein